MYYVVRGWSGQSLADYGSNTVINFQRPIECFEKISSFFLLEIKYKVYFPLHLLKCINKIYLNVNTMLVLPIDLALIPPLCRYNTIHIITRMCIYKPTYALIGNIWQLLSIKYYIIFVVVC
jgi:hypothetical protein